MKSECTYFLLAYRVQLLGNLQRKFCNGTEIHVKPDMDPDDTIHLSTRDLMLHQTLRRHLLVHHELNACNGYIYIPVDFLPSCVIDNAHGIWSGFSINIYHLYCMVQKFP